MMKVVLFLPRAIWRAVRITWVFVPVLIFVGMILGNVALVMSSTLAGAAVALASRLSMAPAIATAAELSSVRNSEATAKKRVKDLQQEQLATKKRIGDLDDEIRRTKRKLQTETAQNADLLRQQSALATSRDKALKAARDAEQGLDTALRRAIVAETKIKSASRISGEAVDAIDKATLNIIRRSTLNATRNIASMPFESVPVVGALTIASVTALEVHDACQTSRDMANLRRLANLEPTDSGPVEAVCDSIASLTVSVEMTIPQCRSHAADVRANLGAEAAAPIEQKCVCMELPDGCPGTSENEISVAPPPPD